VRNYLHRFFIRQTNGSRLTKQENKNPPFIRQTGRSVRRVFLPFISHLVLRLWEVCAYGSSWYELTRKIQRIFRHLWLTKSQIQVCQLFHSTVIFKTDENFIPKLEGIEFDFYQG